MSREKKKSKTNQETRLLTIENGLIVTRDEVGGGVDKESMGIKQGIFWGGHGVMNGTVELLFCTPRTNIIL